MENSKDVEKILITKIPITEEQKQHLEEQIKEQMQKAWVDLLREDLKAKKYDNILKFIEEIRDRLCALTPNNIQLQESLRSSIDMELIKQMLDHNAFGSKEYSGLMELFLERLELLGEDEDRQRIKELRTLSVEQLGTPAWGIHIPTLFLEVNKIIDVIRQRVLDFYEKMKNLQKGTKKK